MQPAVQRGTLLQLAADPFDGDGVVSSDVADDAAEIGQGLGPPDDRQRSAWLGWRRVELAFGEPQQPGANFIVWRSARVGIGFGDPGSRGGGFGLGFVVLDQRNGLSHGPEGH